MGKRPSNYAIAGMALMIILLRKRHHSVKVKILSGGWMILEKRKSLVLVQNSTVDRSAPSESPLVNEMKMLLALSQNLLGGVK
jgi:hypothetical protein